MKGFLELTDQDGEVDFNAVAYYFKEFYLDRKKKGLEVENNPSDRVGEIEQSSLKDIKYMIRTRPLSTDTLKDRLRRF